MTTEKKEIEKAKEIVKQKQDKAVENLDVKKTLHEEKLSPLTYARKLMIAEVGQAFESKGEDLSETDLIALTVYVLLQSDVMKLRKLVRQPVKLLGKAIRLADNPEEQKEYDEYFVEAQEKLEQFNTMQGVVDDGKPEEENDESKKLHS